MERVTILFPFFLICLSTPDLTEELKAQTTAAANVTLALDVQDLEMLINHFRIIQG